jgi:O6-methylguanine-DNA--protein-cysteine methyltransferase
MGSKAYQAVGQVLKNNPYAPEVPCHRVVRSDGHIGGFMGKTDGGEINRKINLLKSEGVEVRQGLVVNFRNILI